MRNLTYITISILFFAGCSKQPSIEKKAIDEQAILISTKKTHVAGDNIVIEFSNALKESNILKIDYGWGIAMVKPVTNEKLKFKIPEIITKKSGRVDWTLLGNQKVLHKGYLEILPSPKEARTMETYLGPTSIFADGKDQSMFVALPQDIYGNPLSDEIKITATTHLNEQSNATNVAIKNGIAFQYLSGGTDIGNLFVSTRHKNQVSKEFTVDILSTKAADFQISVSQKHRFADGNQIIAFKTSVILDVNGNLIADGTLVKFLVRTEKGSVLEANGQTQNGRAIGKLLHPEKPGKWQIQGFINGTAESNMLEVSFEAAINDFPISIVDNKKMVVVGPIESYMQQLVPDGMSVTLEIRDINKNVMHISKFSSREGMAYLEIPEDFTDKNVTLQISVGGITKIATLQDK